MNTFKALDRAAREYDRALRLIAAAARLKYVAPYCERHGCAFSAGMGSWSFHWPDGRLKYNRDDDDLPLRLFKVLAAETLYPNDLGSLMLDYRPKALRGLAPKVQI